MDKQFRSENRKQLVRSIIKSQLMLNGEDSLVTVVFPLTYIEPTEEEVCLFLPDINTSDII